MKYVALPIVGALFILVGFAINGMTAAGQGSARMIALPVPAIDAQAHVVSASVASNVEHPPSVDPAAISAGFDPGTRAPDLGVSLRSAAIIPVAATIPGTRFVFSEPYRSRGGQICWFDYLTSGSGLALAPRAGVFTGCTTPRTRFDLGEEYNGAANLRVLRGTVPKEADQIRLEFSDGTNTVIPANGPVPGLLPDRRIVVLDEGLRTFVSAEALENGTVVAAENHVPQPIVKGA
jgi:hypothetical protein